MHEQLQNTKQFLKENNKKRIVFPEIMDERILCAANRLAEEQIITPIYLGNEQLLEKYAKQFQITLTNYELIDPQTYENKQELVHIFMKRRKQALTEEEATKIVEQTMYFGTLLVYTGVADGLVGGAAHTTSEAVLPALQIIKTKAGVKKASGAYVMIRGDETIIFADCAINISPTSEDLAEIALESAKTAEIFQLQPRVSMLSFSTKGSAKSAETEKIITATNLVKKISPSLIIDGELQFDAAYVPKIAEMKAPDSVIQGNANVFVFPDLEAGNISCKIVERLGGFTAIGPILQGLAKPINLLSRGCSEEDVYKVAIVTAMQAHDEKVKD